MGVLPTSNFVITRFWNCLSSVTLDPLQRDACQSVAGAMQNNWAEIQTLKVEGCEGGNVSTNVSMFCVLKMESRGRWWGC